MMDKNNNANNLTEEQILDGMRTAAVGTRQVFAGLKAKLSKSAEQLAASASEAVVKAQEKADKRDLRNFHRSIIVNNAGRVAGNSVRTGLRMGMEFTRGLLGMDAKPVSNLKNK